MTPLRLVLAAALLAAGSFAQALEIKPYTDVALMAAQKADQPVVLHFRADWCPTCRAQDKVLQSLKGEPGLDVTVLSVNYDTEKALMQRYGIKAQSTFVALHGPKERGRSAGDITPAGIRTVLKTAL